jgi:hypothetical protein
MEQQIITIVEFEALAARVAKLESRLDSIHRLWQQEVGAIDRRFARLHEEERRTRNPK